MDYHCAAAASSSRLRAPLGRRATKVVTENGVITTSHRFLYRGYLQVACCDLLRSNEPCLWFITWDPTQEIATRPLAIQKDGTWYTYGWDLTKNVWEVYGTTGYIGSAYTYTAYGHVTASGTVEQPIQWSSEYNDDELGLVCYNYRHYNPVDGRWIGRDGLPHFNLNIYVYGVQDILGLQQNTYGCSKEFWSWAHKQKKPKWVKEARKNGTVLKSRNCPKDITHPRNPDVPKDVAEKWHKEWEQLSKPAPDKRGQHNKNNKDDNDDDDPTFGSCVQIETYESTPANEDSESAHNQERRLQEGLKWVAAGIVVIGVTIAADILTAGLSLADDPVTLSAGGVMIYNGSRLLLLF